MSVKLPSNNEKTTNVLCNSAIEENCETPSFVVSFLGMS